MDLATLLEKVPALLEIVAGFLIYHLKQEIRALTAEAQVRESTLKDVVLSTVNGKYIRSDRFEDIRADLSRQLDELRDEVKELRVSK